MPSNAGHKLLWLLARNFSFSQDSTLQSSCIRTNDLILIKRCHCPESQPAKVQPKGIPFNLFYSGQIYLLILDNFIYSILG